MISDPVSYTAELMQAFSFRRALSRQEAVLFLAIFACSAYFSEIAYQTSNYTARLFLTQAVVDRQTFRLDAYEDVLGVDGAYFDGHLYSNKPPGSSLMMLPQYVLVGKPVGFALRALDLIPAVQDQRYDVVSVFVGWIVQILSLAVYSAVAFVALYRILGLLGLKRRLVIAFVCYFGTLMFPYSTIGTGEMYTAPALLLGTYHLLKASPAVGMIGTGEKAIEGAGRHRAFLAGGSWFGLAFLTTNQTALIIGLVFVALWWQEQRVRPLLAFALPVCVALVLTLAYNWVNFSHPLSFPIQFWSQGTAEVILLEWSSVSKLVEMLFLPWKGIFFYSPFLLLALPGFRILYRRLRSFNQTAGLWAPTMLILAGPFVIYFLFLTFNVGWFGGADFGFRYIVPVLPFPAIGAGIWLSERPWEPLTIALTAASIAICSFGAITDPEVPTSIRNPLVAYNWPVFLEKATNNVPNLVAEQIFGLDVWPLRLLSTAIFLVALVWLAVKFAGPSGTLSS